MPVFLLSVKAANSNSSSADSGGEGKPRTSQEDVPLHPSHNWKEITAFVVVVLVSVAAWYGLSRIPRWEMLSLYVFALGPLLGVLAISLFRTVRCPRCRLSMDMVRTTEIAGQKWEVFRCESCGGEWRVEKPRRPAP